MSQKMLVLNLFVHDMKAPLAVIRSAAIQLEKDMESGSYDTIGIHLIDDIRKGVREAKILLNRILDMEPAPSIEGKSRKALRKIHILKAISLRLGFSAPTKVEPAIEPGASLFQAVDELKSRLIALQELVAALSIQAGYADIGRRDRAVLNRMRRSVGTAVHFALNAMAIIHSRHTPLKTESCTVSEVVQPGIVEVLDLIAPDASDQVQDIRSLKQLKSVLVTYGLCLEIDESGWAKTLVCDSGMIRQVIVNLLINAVKFRKETVRIVVSMSKKRHIFSVVDDGPGIAKKDQAYIFESRFQVKSEDDFPIRGHGIGLAGAQALLEKLGGHLELESELGRGAKFSAILEQYETPDN